MDSIQKHDWHDLKAIYAYLGTFPPSQHYISNQQPFTHCAICGQEHGLGYKNKLEKPAGIKIDPDIYNQYYNNTGSTGQADHPRKGKPVKGSSQTETLALFKDGKTIPQIAALRQLAETTVTGHLSTFVKTGELDALQLLSAEKIEAILPVIKEMGGDSLSPIKEILGDAFSFADIRIVLNHWHWLQQQKVNA